MAVTLETITPPQSGPLNIEIKLTANIQVTAETARRRVGVFVGNEIAELLHGDTPDLEPIRITPDPSLFSKRKGVIRIGT